MPVRPFKLAYASHTAFFLSSQLLILSHLFFAIETEYSFKLRLVFRCNIIAGTLLILGAIATVPYILSTLRENEVIVNSGPSLLTEIIPQLLTNLILLLVICVLLWTDNQIDVRNQFTFSVNFLYFCLGIVGLLLSISSNQNHSQRILISCTVIGVTIRQPHWFSDLEILIPVCISLLIWAYCASSNNVYCVAAEREVGRVKTLFILVLILSIWTNWMNEFGLVSLLAVFLCNCVEYYWERQLGTFTERALSSELT